MRTCGCGASIAHRNGNARRCETCAKLAATARNRRRWQENPAYFRSAQKRWRLASEEEVRLCACGSSISHRHGVARWCEACASTRRRSASVARAKAWNVAHPDKTTACKRRWQREHPEETRSNRRRWRRSHRRQVALRSKAAYDAAPITFRERSKRWKREHPKTADQQMSAALSNATRRALKRASGRTITRQEWSAILEVHDHRCAYCLRKDLKLTIEHVVPLSRGGWHDPSNVVPACQTCNSRKHNKPIWTMLTASAADLLRGPAAGGPVHYNTSLLAEANEPTVLEI
jgi:5-methylcytosine-specific restriction endonuclease McrA